MRGWRQRCKAIRLVCVGMRLLKGVWVGHVSATQTQEAAAARGLHGLLTMGVAHHIIAGQCHVSTTDLQGARAYIFPKAPDAPITHLRTVPPLSSPPSFSSPPPLPLPPLPTGRAKGGRNALRADK